MIIKPVTIPISNIPSGGQYYTLGTFSGTDRRSTAGQPYPVTTPVYVPDMVAGDYLELWVSCAGTSEIVTVQDVSWYTDTK